jgi:hypothetical protein
MSSLAFGLPVRPAASRQRTRGERGLPGDGAQHLAAMAELDAQLLKALLGQITQNPDLDALFDKEPGILTQIHAFEPVRDLPHDCPQIISTGWLQSSAGAGNRRSGSTDRPPSPVLQIPPSGFRISRMPASMRRFPLKTGVIIAAGKLHPGRARQRLKLRPASLFRRTAGAIEPLGRLTAGDARPYLRQA